MGVADAAGNDLVVARQIGVQRLLEELPGLGHAGVEALVVGSPQVQQVHRVVEDPFQVPPGLPVRLQPGEGFQGHRQVIVKPQDFRVDLPQVHDEVELGVEDAGIRLQVDAVDLPRPGAGGQQDVPVVHIDSLGDFPIDEQEELGVLGVVPLLDLGADVEPQGPAVKGLRRRHIGPEPVMDVGPVPVHGPAVKGGKGDGVLVCVFGPEEIPGLVKPIGGLHPLLHRELFQLLADAVDPLVQKIRGSHNTLPSKWLRCCTLSLSYHPAPAPARVSFPRKNRGAGTVCPAPRELFSENLLICWP